MALDSSNRIGLACALSLACLSVACTRKEPQLDLHQEAKKPGWALYALEYARSHELPLSELVAGAEPGARIDMSWYFYVAVGNGRVVMIDSGTNSLTRTDAPERAEFRVQEARTLEATLARVGLRPGDVNDVLLTHHHFDHSDGVPRLVHATLHAQEQEWQRLATGKRAAEFRVLEREQRLRTFQGTPAQPLPGIEARVAGRHTVQHTVYVVTCRDGKRVVVGGDGAYTFANLEQGKPITVSKNPLENVREMRALVAEFGKGGVLPGHDPALFTRFRQLRPGVAQICP
jgi:glyoxylase-like metal-dependent hydrolase (beta-lactamase superfamily II)